jgi:WD40 repeat protein
MGLAAFTEKDAEFFFGRKRLSLGLEEALLARPRFLLVMGPSGSGKSSVVQAGLIPRLRKGSVPGSDRWGIMLARPADRPFEYLERAGLRRAYVSLAESVRGWMERNPGKEKLLLILDQFEEFLVTCPSDLRRRFWDALKGLLDSDIEVSILAVMRDDFYSRFADDAPPAVLAWTQRGFFQVGSGLGREELQEIIEEPARRVGLRLEEGLADVIINDVLESSRDGGGRAGRSTVLPLLEFALTQLWERREQGALTHQAYQAIGKVTGSLTAWADQVCRALEKEGLGPMARRIFTDLVNLGDGNLPDSRRQRRLADFLHDEKDEKEVEAVRRVVQRLADARLVTTSRDKGEESVQIIHDSLIREWARLQRWLKKDRAFLSWERELEKDAREWRESSPGPSSRDEGRLLRGRRLEEAERWKKERVRDLSDVEQEFLSASLELRIRERKKEERVRADKERTRRRIVQGVVVFSIFSMALAGLAYDQMLEANNRKEEALARSLAAQSEQMRAVSLTKSVLLAAESLKHRETPEGFTALRLSMNLMPICIARLRHNDSVRSVAFSPDGRVLATGNDDGVARLMDVETGIELRSLEHNDSIGSVAFSPDGYMLATGSRDRTVRIWDVETGLELKRLEHDGSVWFVAFRSDGRMLASLGDYGVRLWDVDTGKELQRLELDSWVNAMAFSLDGSMLATGSDDDTARLWNSETGKELQRLELDSWVNAVAFSPDGRLLATGSLYGAQLWDVETGKELLRLAYDEQVIGIVFSPDGNKLATQGLDDNIVRLWDVETGEELQNLEHDSWVNAVTFSSDGGKLATGSEDNMARLWDVETGEELIKMQNNGAVRVVAFSPDGSKLATGSKDNTTRLWDVDVGRLLHRLEHSDMVSSVDFSPDGRILATGSDDTARLWDVKTGKELQKLKHDDWVSSVTFSPDGNKLATGSKDNKTRLWDVKTGKEMQRLNHDDLVRAVAFSPDGIMLATGSKDNTTRLWDIDAGKELREIKNDGEVWEVAFSPDGSMLATYSPYDKARLWDVVTGKELHGQSPHNAVPDLAIHLGDGKLILSSDKTKAALRGLNVVLLLDAKTGKELQRLEPNSWVIEMAFSPDGSKLATGGIDKIARIWTLDIDDIMEEACRRLEENMTREEWGRFMDDPDSDCLTCPAEGSFNRSTIWPWGRRECQPCGGSLG